jgi:hypothetical protein
MRSPSLTCIATLHSALGLVACQHTAPASANPNTPSMCRPEAAQALVGKDAISDAEARRLTGAGLVRQIQPGQPVTLDFRQERITIETDAKTRRIVRASCG